MNCPKCNAPNPEGSRFCSTCGGPMESVDTGNALFKEKPVQPVYPPYNGQAQTAPDTAPNPYAANDPGAPVSPQPNPYAQPGAPDPTAYGSYTNYSQGPGMYPARGDRSKDWAAITGLVLGLLCLPCCFFPVYAVLFNFPIFLCALPPVLAIVFSIIGIKSTKKGLAIAGLICAVLSLLATIFMMLYAYADPQSIHDIFNQALRDAGLDPNDLF